MADQPDGPTGLTTFGDVLRRLRDAARLSQEELATKAGVGVRTVSDLERGVALTARKATAERLVLALGLEDPQRSWFLDVARGRASPTSPPAANALGIGMTRTLPRDVGAFTGREAELESVMAAARQGSRDPRVRAIGGMAGVGKTAFALHAAHQLAPDYPDGQLFVSLHGHTPANEPVHPRDALGDLLLACGVPASQIPGGLEARAAMWRGWLHDKRVLLLLDDAIDSEQVQPLLPGTAQSFVLVTSRRRLHTLDNSATTSLDAMPEDDAIQLLVRLADRPDVDEGNAQLRDIVQRCGALPLAVGLIGRRLHHHLAWSVADLAAELEAARERMALLKAEGQSVPAAFELSYAHLTADEQRTFRRLGAHPGSDVDAHVAAALAGVDLVQARRDLDALYDNYLLAEVGPGRFRLHDLLREYARDRCDATERDEAAVRLIDHYTAAGAVAQRLLHWRPAVGAPPTASPGPLPERDRSAWMRWAHDERSNLLACLDEVTAREDHARVVALTAALRGILDRVAPRDDAVDRYGAAVLAARRVGLDQALGTALNDYGDALYHAGGDNQRARDALVEAARRYDACGDRLGRANVLVSLGVVHRILADYSAALRFEEEAIELYRALEEPRGEARGLLELSSVYGDRFQLPDAKRVLLEALECYEALDDMSGRATVLSDLGFVQESMGDLDGATASLRGALSMCIELQDRQGEANTRRYLSQVEQLNANHDAASIELERALELYSALGDQHGVASVLGSRGVLRRQLGNRLDATSDLLEMLRMAEDLGYQRIETEALNELGLLFAEEGRWDDAIARYRSALEIARAIGSAALEADALAGLSRCERAAGRWHQAETLLSEARSIYGGLGVQGSEHLAAAVSSERAATRQSWDAEDGKSHA